MTLVEKYKAAVQNGKVVNKDLVKAEFFVHDSVADIVLSKQDAKIALSKAFPKNIYNIDYYTVKKENAVLNDGKIVAKEELTRDQEEDLSEDLKKTAPKKAGAAKPGAKK